ncbi:MAG: hypothetical protein EYC68_02670 [Chloroflexota bacterium]|nr:MAG: hypothetical protein EYC68_02670 [Chloroflexota bacterium]
MKSEKREISSGRRGRSLTPIPSNAVPEIKDAPTNKNNNGANKKLVTLCESMTAANARTASDQFSAFGF